MSLTIHTDVGDIKVELFCDEAPDACKNFLALCASGFYNGLAFHRIIPGFLIQTGDNSKTGIGGRSALGESVEVQPTAKFNEPGVLGYAEKESVRSQFFITVSPQPQLNGEYCGFGHVIFGLNNVESINRIPTLEDFYPIKPVRIKSITIHANPFAK
ncbi:peptidyl-prolyl cis-trans isomerase-like 3 [Histomonas meleagridis]|uniref:peptidyl-prolyl cis-trans isomerase-like 3 n=1 Tax=Histomonas meleagridis TaxID=135588 RepID=UPI00355A5787|nr:peptidyl-prolyl cis-trans isomerase-like 3 [Histomonas meleagridis]KAH0800572.1 peptidyl-prolyl cis-trans isomerase-like 3 [Histomonas meleagridis]